jgi:hypothetical protein
MSPYPRRRSARPEARIAASAAAWIAAGWIVALAAAGCGARPARDAEAARLAAADTAARPATREAAAAFAAGALARRAQLDSVRGAVTLGDGVSRFTAWFESGQVRAVRESVSFGDYGASVIEWAFAGGAPVAVAERGTRLATARDGAAGREPVEMWIAFGPGGDTLAARRVLAGVPVAFHPGWILGIRARADTLQARARRLRTAISPSVDTLVPHS